MLKGPGMDRQTVENIRAVLVEVPEVRVAYVFGSRARDDAAADSDIDVGLYCDRSMSFRELDELAARIAEVVGDHDIDLVSIGEQPPELAFRIIDEGRHVYCASEYERVELEANIASRFGDFRPVLERQRRMLIEGGDDDRAVRRYREALGETRRLLEQIGAAGREG